MVSTEKKAKHKNFTPIKFRYWLNAKGVKERVGINTIVRQVPAQEIDFKCLMPSTDHLESVANR